MPEGGWARIPKFGGLREDKLDALLVGEVAPEDLRTGIEFAGWVPTNCFIAAVVERWPMNCISAFMVLGWRGQFLSC